MQSAPVNGGSTMKARARFFTFAVVLELLALDLLALSGCGGSQELPATEEVQEAVTSLPLASILGCETLDGWSADAGGLSLLPHLTQGQQALGPVGATSVNMTSVPLPMPTPIGEAISLDFRTPNGSGTLTAFLDAPSISVKKRSLGAKKLADLTPGQAVHLTFVIPSDVVAKLTTKLKDLRIIFGLTGVTTDAHVFDNVAFEAAPSAPPLPPWLHYCYGDCSIQPPVTVTVCPESNPTCKPKRKPAILIPQVDGRPIDRSLIPLTLAQTGNTIRLDGGNGSLEGGAVAINRAPSLVINSDVDVKATFYDVAAKFGGTVKLNFVSTQLSTPAAVSHFYRFPTYDVGTAFTDINQRSEPIITGERSATGIMSDPINAFFVPTELLGNVGEGNFFLGNGIISVNYGNPPYIDAKGGILPIVMPEVGHEHTHALFDKVWDFFSGSNTCLNEGTADALPFTLGFMPEENFGPVGLDGLSFDADCTGTHEVHDVGNCYYWHVKKQGLLTPDFMRGVFHPQHHYDFDSCDHTAVRTGNSLLVLFTEAAGGANLIPALDSMQVPHAASYQEALQALGF
jgi:hypothetical protein